MHITRPTRPVPQHPKTQNAPTKEKRPVGSTFNGRPGCQRQRRQLPSPHDTASHGAHLGPRRTHMGSRTDRGRGPQSLALAVQATVEGRRYRSVPYLSGRFGFRGYFGVLVTLPSGEK
ncbi:hypothetical protein [Dictyobacter halimunensis]|uniref:hypothetical protein n=1 Tax=Dictyobacter halimunensis TaxID=3026934 RepID=UPI0030C6FFF8